MARCPNDDDTQPPHTEWNPLELPVVLTVTHLITKETVAPGTFSGVMETVKRYQGAYRVWQLRQRVSENAYKPTVAPRFSLTWGIRSEIRKPFQEMMNAFLQPNNGYSARQAAIILKCQLEAWNTPARHSVTITKGSTSPKCPYGCGVTGDISHYLLSKSALHPPALTALVDIRHSKCRKWIRRCIERGLLREDDGEGDSKLTIIGEEGALPRPMAEDPNDDELRMDHMVDESQRPDRDPDAQTHPAAQIMADLAGSDIPHKIDLLAARDFKSSHVYLLDCTFRRDEWLVREDENYRTTHMDGKDRKRLWDHKGLRITPAYVPKDPTSDRGEDPPATWPAIPWKAKRIWGYNPRAIYDHRYEQLEDAIQARASGGRNMTTTIIVIAMGSKGYISETTYNELRFVLSKPVVNEIIRGMTRICHNTILQAWKFMHSADASL